MGEQRAALLQEQLGDYSRSLASLTEQPSMTTKKVRLMPMKRRGASWKIGLVMSGLRRRIGPW
jgi:hypothetical protein